MGDPPPLSKMAASPLASKTDPGSEQKMMKLENVRFSFCVLTNLILSHV